MIVSATIDTSIDPSPSPSTVPEELTEGAKDASTAFWDWFTGWPLHVLIILVVGIIVLALLRRVIGHVTERIALGGKVGEASDKSWRSYFRRAPLVEDALAMANPLANERRAQRSRTVGSVLRSTANIVVGTIIILMILQEFEVQIGPLLGAAGFIGVAVGFGAQSLVKDFISGIFLLVEDQFGVGDYVDLGSGAEGTVEDVQLRTTKLRAMDGTVWYVRNGEILRAGNYTQQWSRAMAQIRVPVDADEQVVHAALLRAADAVYHDPELTGVLLEEPVLWSVDGVTDLSMVFTLHVQVRPGQQWEVARRLRRSAQAELRGVGVLREGQPVDAEQLG
ncbi:mechanosensitive ion channel family protein [Isoptericola sp. BMS4]|uniref:mechanosensitive ion channel family protein n=1 Tax=Isoptericola sp. BMS4 TaxID=2527875 RepID=UPI0014233D12|nr:mechanosensitive ion channel family protein [Isoptericola sp. BMS4]